ncbi:hypothetical protein BJ322DRAFT_1021580 [Thelephora terrestris]|uniref:Uncharacterized protein n=1 Tax=Thelephora terrestris TaxID=56493 RepID=A0A9P6L634_9AGAM|nr:hypothetical protein BJ322DRAFT_1021580 [Thelephora terrestris]
MQSAGLAAQSESFSWREFTQLFAPWVLPWLGLISQIPFGSATRTTTSHSIEGRNASWREEISERLSRRNACSVAADASVTWVVVSYLLTPVDSFVSLAPDTGN